MANQDSSNDNKFMDIALTEAKLSRDPDTKVGAIIVNDSNQILGQGHNRYPTGTPIAEEKWDKGSKQMYVLHAERNAIDSKTNPIFEGCKIYVTLFPCDDCASRIIKSGIKEVIYLSDEKNHKNKYVRSQRLLSEAGIKVRQYKSS